MLDVYPSRTINNLRISWRGFRIAPFYPLKSCFVYVRKRVCWRNFECSHSFISSQSQIHHQRKWMKFVFATSNTNIDNKTQVLVFYQDCSSFNNSGSNDKEYRSSRNIAISLLRRYRAVIERGQGETLKEFISACVNAYSLGCTDKDLRNELLAMKELGLEIEKIENYNGSTQTKSKILVVEIDECILWLSIVFITILCTPQPTVMRWSLKPSVSDEITSKWRGFCAVIANAYYIKGMAWLPVKTLQLEQMAVTGQAEEPSVVASRMRLVFSTLEVVSPQWPRV